MFIDYAESFSDLELVPETIRRICADGTHNIALVATCRGSAHQKVTDLLVTITPRLLDLEEGRGTVDSFDGWVAAKILRHFAVPNATVVAEVCKAFPVLAAFAGYLHKHNPGKFDGQFGNLAETRSFVDWAAQRIRLIVQRLADDGTQEGLAEIALRLPMPIREVDSLRSESALKGILIDILLADRWIEQDGATVAAAHDVFADALIARHIFESSALAQDRLRRLLTKALGSPHFSRVVSALNRLASHEKYGDLSGKKAFEALLDHDRAATLQAASLLVNTHLVDNPELIELLAAHHDLRIELSENPSAHLPISHAAEWYANDGKQTVSAELAAAALDQAVEAAAFHPHPSNMVLRCAFVYDPEKYTDPVAQRISTEPVSPQTHFLLVAMLRHGVSPDEISDKVNVWLKQCEALSEASFVYQSWLDAMERGTLFANRSANGSNSIANRSAIGTGRVRSWLDAPCSRTIRLLEQIGQGSSSIKAGSTPMESWT